VLKASAQQDIYYLNNFNPQVTWNVKAQAEWSHRHSTNYV